VAGYRHSHTFGHSGPDHVPYSSAPQIVEQLSFEIGCFAGGFPGFANVPDIRLFVTVYRWAKEHNLSWTPDEARLEVTTRIRSFLADQKHGQVLRIEGPAGVGKTRVALEAVREHGTAEATIYAANSDDNHVQELLTFLVGNERSYAIIVADECSSDRQNVLSSFVELCGGRVKLICFGTRDLLSPPLAASASLIRLEGLADARRS
jgi:hypothetical protein